jgi:hypothetical protein
MRAERRAAAAAERIVRAPGGEPAAGEHSTLEEVRSAQEGQRRLPADRAPRQDAADPSLPPPAARWRRAADPHAARSTRRAPAGMRTRAIASWPFRAPRRPRATSACPPGRCEEAA